MLSNTERKLLVKTYEEMPDAKRVAKIYYVSTDTVYRLVRQMRETGSVELKTSSRGRKRVLSAENIEDIRHTVEEQPDITIREIKEKLNLSASEETIRTRVVEMGLRYKKKTLHATERDRTDIAEKRKWWKNWQEKMWDTTMEKLVFLDESGVNTNLTRLYGRAYGKERAADAVPLNKPKNRTILSSIRPDGSTAFTTYAGGTTAEKFLDYLKNTLIPALHPGDIVVMDNLRTHHIEEVKTVLREAKISVMYLPAYSPDLNPIEMMWSKVKSVLRKMKARTEEDLIAAIKQAVAQVTPEDCRGWFRKAGYLC